MVCADAQELSVAELVDQARGSLQHGARRMLGLVGAPGAGKSLAAAEIVAALAPDAVRVPMDGFHLSGAELTRLRRYGRKGAPDTFDGAGYVSLLRRLRANDEPVIYAPRFDRALDEPIANAIPVPSSASLIVTEGNYLLLAAEPWSHVRELLDEVWFIDLERSVRIERLVARHVEFGKSPEEARAWSLGTDERNAELVSRTRHLSDRIVRIRDVRSEPALDGPRGELVRARSECAHPQKAEDNHSLLSERSGMKSNGLRKAIAPARTGGVGAVLALFVALAVVGATAASAAPSGKPTLTIGITTGPSGNDPSKVEPDPFDEVNLSLMDAPLLHQNPDGSISPGLATTWHYVHGNKTFALTLRHNARFSDGSRVTAQAVKTWLTYFPKAGYSLASMLGKVRAIDTPTRWDVVIHLESPNPIVPTILSEAFNWGYVVSPNYTKNPGLFSKQGGGAGPYVLDPAQTVSGDHYTYLPNKYFYDPAAVKYSKVVVRIISAPSSMLAAAQTGQVDVALGDTTTANAAKGAGLDVISKPTQTESFVFLDLAGKINPALADPRVRQALNYAINRKAIARALFGHYATPTSEYLSPYGFDPKYQNYYAYNPTKAKALLAAAGYAHGLTVSFLSATFEGTLGDPVTQAVAQDLANVGVKLQIVSEPTSSAFGSAIFTGTHDGFELLYGGDPMPIHWGFYFAPKAPFNEHGWSDPVLNKMMIQSMRLPTAKASTLWLKMSARTVTQAEMLPILFADQIWYVSKHVGGVAFSSNAQVPYPTEWSPR